MRDQRLDRLADVLVRYSTRVKQADQVVIAADPVALPLVEAVYQKALEVGAHPFWLSRSESLANMDLLYGSDEQLAWLSPMMMNMIETVDVYITFWAEINTRGLGRIDPARIAAQRQSRKPFMAKFLERNASGDLRWVGTLYPTHASAQDAEMCLSQYEQFVFEAGLLHTPDPVAGWEQIRSRQQAVCDFLQGKELVHFRSPPGDDHDGTDLRVSVAGSTWINCAGEENFPDGEVFAGPRGADGHVNFTYPAVYNGREVEGVRLQFKNGRVVDASARKNEAFLIAMLDQDDGARTMGEIAIGTNYAIKEFSRNTLFDEKIG
ncbi:MAG: aminopeptidase, partial [Planctomycetota bacterium]